jgi:hypothetical protein
MVREEGAVEPVGCHTGIGLPARRIGKEPIVCEPWRRRVCQQGL